jgi:predicted Mrr-cat superfamily restriction endonuclease
MLWKIFARQPFDMEDSQEYARECYQAGVIAVGWNAIGDLSAERYSTWDSIFDVLMKKWGRYAKSGARSVGQWTGALWAFRNDVKRGHYVVCPDRDSGVYYLGRVCSELYHDESPLGGKCEFSHRRDVKWRVLTRRQVLRIWPNGLGGGRRTVTEIRRGEDKLLRLLKTPRRTFAGRSDLPVQPDMEWGKAAEERAMA